MVVTPQIIIAVIIGVLLATVIFFSLTNIIFTSGSSNIGCKAAVASSGIDFLGIGILRPSDVICYINAPR